MLQKTFTRFLLLTFFGNIMSFVLQIISHIKYYRVAKIPHEMLILFSSYDKKERSIEL
jgi:hypothetical protein